MSKLGWYTAHFSTGSLDFQASSLGEAQKKAPALGAEHMGDNKVRSVIPRAVRTGKATRKKVKA